MKNIKTNAIANFLVRVLNIAFPMITSPYIYRIIARSEYGYYSAGYAMMGLFLPFATFGVYYYGVRTISKVKHDKEQVNYFFSTLFYITVISSLLTTLCYVIYVYASIHNDRQQLVYLILGSQLLSSFLYIEWMNEALEDYRFILFKTFFMRVLMIVLLFTFVRKPDDVLVFSVIMSVIQIINYMISFVWIKREVKLVKVKIKDMVRLLLPLMGLLLMANAGMLYTGIDRAFLANSADLAKVTLYNQGQQISGNIATLISGPVSVSVPRLGYYLGINNKEAYTALVYKGSRLFAFLIVPISMGLFVTGPYANLIYSGPQYLAAGVMTSIFGIRGITWAIELLLANQVIFVNGYEQKLTTVYFIAGFINLGMKFVISRLGIDVPEYYLLTTMLAEFILIGFEVWLIHKYQLLDVKQIFRDFGRYTLYSLGFIPIYAVIAWLNPIQMSINAGFLLNLALIITACAVYYMLVLWFRKDAVFLSILTSFKEKIGAVRTKWSN